MELSFGTWTLVAAGAAGGLYLLWSLFGGAADADAGAVSQSWLTEHNSGKGDRIS
jgi:hypothetical protein